MVKKLISSTWVHLPAEQFLNIDNWDDSAAPYINQAEEWIATKEGSDITGVTDFVDKEQKEATTSVSTTGPIPHADVKKRAANVDSKRSCK